jgi:hypothetical protein
MLKEILGGGFEMIRLLLERARPSPAFLIDVKPHGFSDTGHL